MDRIPFLFFVHQHCKKIHCQIKSACGFESLNALIRNKRFVFNGGTQDESEAKLRLKAVD